MKRTWKIGGLVASFAATAGISAYMWQLTDNEQLWGYLPLFLFLSGWTFILLLWEKGLQNADGTYRHLKLALLTGALLSIGFPPLPLLFTMFIGFVPLLLIEYEIGKKSEDTNKKAVFKFGFIAFITWNILTTYWVANTSFPSGFAAILANSLLMSIPWVLFHQSKKILGDRLGYVAFIAFWISFEYLHMRWDLSWPWLTLGNSLAEYPILAQWYEYTGVFGGSLWILVLNVLCFGVFKNYIETKQKPSAFAYIRPVGLVLTPVLFSIYLYVGHTIAKVGANAPTIAVIQPNFEPHYVKFEKSTSETLEQFFKLSKTVVDENTDYLVFPETSFSGMWQKDLPQSRVVSKLKNFMRPYPKLKLVTGMHSWKRFADDAPETPNMRTYEKGDGSVMRFESYNSAMQLSSDVDSVPIYLKSKLVPGAELMPFPTLLGFMKPLFMYLGGSTEGLGTQKERSVFTSTDGKVAVAPVICYESIYGEYTAGYVHKGANILFIMTNDGWWANTAGYRQHLKFASLRAIETRRSIVRSANTGTSCFINYRGDILDATNYEEEAAIKRQMPLHTGKTFYVRYGDMVARLTGFLAIILFLLTFVRRIANKV